MKILKLLPLAGIALMAVSCQNGSSSLSENSSQTDSLMYYLGQLNAADYLREANRDTIMKSESEKMVYLNGVRTGLASLKEGNDAYNKGFMLGIQMASQMMNFSKQMDVQINKSSYVNSLSDALMADTIPNTSAIQAEFRKVIQNIETAKTEKDQTASRESLKKVAAGDNLPMISDDLYGKVTLPADGKALAEGDEVDVQGSLVKEDGEPLSMPLSPKGRIGNKRSYPEVISKALESLKSGETGEFMTTAHALLGGRAEQLGLEPTSIIKMTLSATLVPQEEPKEEAAN